MNKAQYLEYLNSPEWVEKTTLAKERAGHKCQLCNSNKKLNTHHRTYERIKNELESDLIVLCEKCHSTFHGIIKKPKKNKKVKKYTFEKAISELRKYLHKHANLSPVQTAILFAELIRGGCILCHASGFDMIGAFYPDDSTTLNGHKNKQRAVFYALCKNCVDEKSLEVCAKEVEDKLISSLKDGITVFAVERSDG
jgi:hypothetical protein